MSIQWTKNSDALPPTGVIVDAICQDGKQHKMYLNDYKNWFIDDAMRYVSVDAPLRWKLPDPVADACQELREKLKALVLDVLTSPYHASLPAINDARALLERLEESK